MVSDVGTCSVLFKSLNSDRNVFNLSVEFVNSSSNLCISSNC